jgi:hypothetical protein
MKLDTKGKGRTRRGGNEKGGKQMNLVCHENKQGEATHRTKRFREDLKIIQRAERR